jgi:hypothetical protein
MNYDDAAFAAWLVLAGLIVIAATYAFELWMHHRNRR